VTSPLGMSAYGQRGWKAQPEGTLMNYILFTEAFVFVYILLIILFLLHFQLPCIKA
jgi:hypothetical protein